MEVRDAQDAVSRSAAQRRRLNWGIFGLLIGMFLSLLDSLVLTTALPTIVRELDGLQLLSWVITGYLLATAATTPIWGKLGDLYGRTRMFNSAVALFMLGSVLCGLAQNMEQLVAFRVLQGIGSGGLMVGAQATIGVLVPPRENGRVQAMIGVILPITFLSGPLVGGLLTAGPGWRWTFYVNVPVGLLALFLVNTNIRLAAERGRARIDILGATLLTTSVLLLSLVASWAGSAFGWTSLRTVTMMLAAAAALGAFIWVETRVPEPIIPPRLFRDRNFGVCQVLSFAVGAAMLATSNYLPQYMQFVQGLSPSAGGLLALPLTVGMFAAQLITGRLIMRNGRYRRYPILGGAILTAGALLMLTLGVDTGLVMAALFPMVAGVGMGLLLQSTLLVTANSAPAGDMGAANGTVILLRMIGGSLGIAVLGAVFSGRVDASLTATLGAEAAGRFGAGSDEGATLTSLPGQVRHALQVAITHGMDGLLVGVAALGILTFGFAWLLREVPLRTVALKQSEPSDRGGSGTGTLHDPEAIVGAEPPPFDSNPPGPAVVADSPRHRLGS